MFRRPGHLQRSLIWIVSKPNARLSEETIAIIKQLASTEVHDASDATRQQLVRSENILAQILTDLTAMDGQVQDQLSLEEITADDEKCFEYQEKVFGAKASAKDSLELISVIRKSCFT